MTDSLSIGWTRAEAAKALKSHRRLYGINLALQSAVAVIVLIWPSAMLDLVNLPAPDAATDWARVWALMVLLASAFQIPGYLDPIYNRLPNVIGIVGRAVMAILYLLLGGGFLWLALFDGAFAVALYVTYRRTVIAELQTRP